MNERDSTILLSATKVNIEAIDKVRNQKLADYIPWLAEILKNKC